MRAKVSVIIVTWNGGKVFKDCLESLAKVKFPKWELIVVDNKSTDSSLSYIPSNLKVKIIKNKSNLGFAIANNQALKYATGEYILLLNNDTKVTPTFLTRMVERIKKNKNIAVIQPKIKMMDKRGYLDNAGSFITNIGFLHHWGFGRKDTKEFDKERFIFSAKGACMLIRKSVIDKISLFDPDFFSYFEESDFCWRAWLAGYKVLYYPQSSIYHKVGFTIKRLDVGNINYHYYKNRIASIIKNTSLKKMITMLPAHLIISFGIALVFLFRGKAKNSLMIARAIWWNFVNLKKTFKKRSKVQTLRRVSDSEIMSSMSVRIDWREFFNDFRRVEKDIN